MPKPPDIKPLAYLVLAPAVLATVGHEEGLEPGALRVLALIHAFRLGTSCNPTAPDLQSDWLTPRLVRGYVIKLERKGHVTRLAPRRRAARQLLLTASGVGLVWRIERDLRQATQQLYLPV